jgi:tape measure domain-containing protein
MAGLQSALAGAEEAVAKTGQKLQGVGAMLSAGVTAPLAGLGAIAIKTAADQEQLEVAFTTMLGSADKAKGLIKQLSDFSASTPFELPQVVGAGRKLLAFGVEAENVQDTLRRLGDISAGVGAPLEDIAEIYGKAKTSGRLFAEDINQLTGRGIPIIEALATTLGKPTSAIKGMVEAGDIGFAELQAAVASLTDEGGKFSGLMEAQSHTVSGLLSTLQDNFNIALGEIGKQLIETFDLKSILSGAAEMIGKVTAAIKDFIAANPEAFKWIAIFVGGLAALGPVLVAVGTALTMAAPAMGIFGAVLGVVVSPLGLVVAGIGALIALDVGGIRTTLGALGGYFMQVATDGDYLNDFLADLPGWLQGPVEALGKFASGAKTALQGLGEIFTGSLEPMGDWSYWWEQMADTLGEGPANAIHGIGERILALKSSFAAGGWDFDSLFGELTARLTGIGEDTYDTTEAIESFVGALTGSTEIADAVANWLLAFEDFRVGVQDALTAAGSAISTFGSSPEWAAAVASVQTSAGNIATAIGDAFTGKISLGDLGATVSTEFGNVQKTLETLFSSDAWTKLGDDLKAAFKLDELGTSISTALGPEVMGYFSTFADTIAEPLARVQTAFDGLVATLTGLDFGPIQEGITSFQTALQGMIDAIFSGGGEGGGMDWGAMLGTATMGAAALAINMFSAALTVLGVVAQTMVAQAKIVLDGLTGVINGLTTTIQGLKDGDYSMAFAGLQEAFGALGGFLLDTAANITGALSDITGAVGGALTNTLTDLGFDEMATQVDGFVKKVQGFLTYVSGLAAGTISVDFKIPSWMATLTSWKPDLTALTDWEWPDISALTDWTWPDLSALTGWDWPKFPSFSWPDIPTPGWINTLVEMVGKLNPFGGLSGGQLGKSYFTGGPLWVGEHGKELVNLPRGSEVVSNRDLNTRMGGVTVQVQSMSVRDDRDVYAIAYAVADIINRGG